MHSLVKLYIHLNLTLDILDEVTTSLGEAFQQFQEEIFPTYNLKELPCKADAHCHLHQKENVSGKAKSTDDAPLRK